jgi:hypothetical protein
MWLHIYKTRNFVFHTGKKKKNYRKRLIWPAKSSNLFTVVIINK